MKTSKFGVVLIVIGCLLIVAAGALLLYNSAEDTSAMESSRLVIEQLQRAVANKRESGSQQDEIAADPAQLLPKTEVPEMTVVEIDGYGYIGYLDIPSIDLSLPVMSEWDDARLKIAPCRHYGSVFTKDLVIAGHNYSSHFGKLKNLSIGDLLQFTDMDGNIRKYRVVETEILGPMQVEEMKNSPWELTLYTCTYGGANRFTVRCEEILTPEK